MMKAIFFDIGETLIDESRLWSALADWLGMPRMTFFALLGGIISQGREHRELLEIVRPELGWKGVIERFRQDVRDTYLPEDLYPDVFPALTSLKKDGYFVGIAGNQPADREMDLRAMNLPTDMIATSAGWGLHKPDRRFFERIVSEVGWRPEEIAYVGDRVDNDVLPAAAAGLVPIHIVRGPWGWLQRDWPGVAAARGQIRGLNEVGNLLQGL